MSRAAITILLLVVLLAGACIPQTIRFTDDRSATTRPVALDYGNYALVLSRAVRPEGVDYAAILADPSPLERFLSRVGTIGPHATPELFPRPPDRIAYDINVHNACVVYAVISQARGDKVPRILARDPATGFRFQLDGRLQSPADIGRAAVKESADDWRVAMALCDGRRSDPPLAPRPFIGDVLDYQLTKNIADGLTNPAVLRVDAGMQYLYLNRIIYDAQPRLIAAYQKRTGARDATILSVLLEIASRDEYPLLNSAVGYPVRPIPSDPTLNSAAPPLPGSPSVFSRLFGG